ncbi:MAG TPA: DUF3300 domain-containing protein [Opitutaceae bacterium]|jgi:hypothetical protein|nr:DUF3300 domain-containing protein [Opitutaceae bacterium]
MKIRPIILFGLCLAALLHAQVPSPDQSPDYAPEDLDRLLAPIALYPDPLVALILPASTVPSDVTLATGYLNENGDPAQIDNQGWDASVKALAHYPDVIRWMAANLEWTQAVGDAFVQQPADVMKSIQQLRAKARAAGTLVDTPQQDVVMEDDNIAIVPAQPDVIYVPAYDPDAAYDEGGPVLTFGVGFPVGVWLGYECDWAGYGIHVGAWHPGWDWRQRHFTGGDDRRWQPDRDRARDFHQDFNRERPSIPSPRPMRGAPAIAHRPGQNFTPAVQARGSRPDVTGWGSTSRTVPNQSRPAAVAPRPPARQGELFGGYNRGSTTRDFSNRGQQSRQSVRPSSARPAAPSRQPQSSGSHDNRQPQH